MAIKAATIVDQLFKLWERDETGYSVFEGISGFLGEVAEEYNDVDYEEVRMQIDIARDAMLDVLRAMTNEDLM